MNERERKRPRQRQKKEDINDIDECGIVITCGASFWCVYTWYVRGGSKRGKSDSPWDTCTYVLNGGDTKKATRELTTRRRETGVLFSLSALAYEKQMTVCRGSSNGRRHKDI